VERQIRLLGSREPVIAPLVDFHDLLRENIADDGLVAIARRTRDLYEQFRALAATL
jgi:hypothetical protein